MVKIHRIKTLLLCILLILAIASTIYVKSVPEAGREFSWNADTISNEIADLSTPTAKV